MKSIDGENADINVTIIVPNGITTEIVKQVVATNEMCIRDRSLSMGLYVCVIRDNVI